VIDLFLTTREVNMISERVLNAGHHVQMSAQMGQMAKPDERYSRDAKKDFLDLLDRYFTFLNQIEQLGHNPESVRMLLHFIGQDLNKTNAIY
jgi:hypothetical protein